MARSEIPKILVAEEEPIIALDLCDVIREAGAEAVGPVTRVADALQVIGSVPVDGAVLDYGLHDGPALPIIRRLRRSGIPFVLHSGARLNAGLLTRIGPGVAVFTKPADPVEMVARLIATIGRAD